MLNQKGYMCWREQTKTASGRPMRGGRWWHRTSQPDTPTKRTPVDFNYGNVPDEIDHPEVWEDWSGGFGDAYRIVEHPNAFHWSQNFDGRFPKQLIHAQQPNLLPARYASTNFNVDSFIDVPLPLGSGAPEPPAGAGAVLVLGRGHITSFTPTQFTITAGSAFDSIYEATGGGAITFGHRPALFGSYTYIPNLNGSSFYQRGHDGLTYTIGPTQPARWFAPAGGLMWWGQFRNQLRSVKVSTDPIVTGNYNATLPIGVGFLQSEDARALEDQLYVGFPDGLYQGNLSGTFVNVLTDIGARVNPDNIRDLAIYNGKVVVQTDSNVYAYKPATGDGQTLTTEVGPTALMSNRSAIHGKFTCVRGFGKWLYAGLFTGSQSWIMCARDASVGLPYVWQPLQLLPHNVKVSRLHIDGITASSGGTSVPIRMWAATEATFGASSGATAPLYYWPLAGGDDNPVADTSFSAIYCGSARMDFGATDCRAPGTPKLSRYLEVWADNLFSGSQYADLYYTVDGGPRNLLGRAQTSPRSILLFPGINNPTNLGFVRGQNMIISVESFTASLNVTPIYRGFVWRSTVRSKGVDTIATKINVADNVPDRRGNPMRPGAQQLQELRNLSNSDNPAKLLDLTGAATWVGVLPNIEEEEVQQEGIEYPELLATVKMAVLDFTNRVVAGQGQENNLTPYTEAALSGYQESQLSYLG